MERKEGLKARKEGGKGKVREGEIEKKGRKEGKKEAGKKPHLLFLLFFLFLFQL